MCTPASRREPPGSVIATQHRLFDFVEQDNDGVRQSIDGRLVPGNGTYIFWSSSARFTARTTLLQCVQQSSVRTLVNSSCV